MSWCEESAQTEMLHPIIIRYSMTKGKQRTAGQAGWLLLNDCKSNKEKKGLLTMFSKILDKPSTIFVNVLTDKNRIFH